ncbi:mechanosensitive ion channel domain-containing protein [Pedobacter metabolipauper]|uniref:Mechanosensitive ion channel-like protein n=1 Tax=Pedobacter metabolipauper TaxID=425513 RepID=A0A4R6SZQ7_9SPHI|nr:mechanosensitive ion channel domain-containing protein [Pedobacter metabolipauper]TDQ11249.1 mechanosensitive ion channel-like protein [Pedobacter metabolipauper]
MRNTTYSRILLFFVLLIICFQGFAQTTDSSASDTVVSREKIDFVTRMQAFARKSAKESAEEFNADKATIEQNKTLDEIKKTMQRAKSYLRTSVDTAGTRAQLAIIQKDFAIAGDGVLTGKGTSQTFRNLTATSKILNELLSKAIDRKTRLDLHQQELTSFRYQLDSLLSVPALFKFSIDSAVLRTYMQQLVVVAYEVHPVDSALKQSSHTVQGLLNQVNMQVFNLQTSLEEIEGHQSAMAENIFKREFENIWGEVGYYRPFKEILAQAKAKGLLTLVFYIQNNIGKLVVLFLLVITAFVYLRSLKKIYLENKLITADFEGQLVLRYPLASALLITINLFQFLFFSPPFILSVIFWILGCISLTIMFHKFIVRYWMNVWLIMVSLFLITAFDNLILQASRTERIFMLILSLLGTITGSVILLKGRKEELREKLILIAIGLMVVLELGAALANVFGRYNLSKALLISGYLNVVIAILFLWTIRLINEGLFLAFNVYTKQDLKLFYLNFNKVGQKLPVLFYFLLIFGWVVLFGRNFAGFDYIAGPLREFFGRNRVVGDYTFTINSLLLFIAIMGIAVITSKIVSFFASDKHLLSGKDEKHNIQGIGSWLLLIRISILSIGLFLAVAAAGIPLDRITIVLGALGVGIGFGLQALVNNLVSGLIIAFEKPVNVGDVVEVDGQAGTMKSIGFRSSVISTWDGADVVMPNGDLLNSHLTNWSLGGSRRRMSIVIGIAYDTDLEKAKALLIGILDEEPRVMKNPQSVVQYEHFNDSSIDLRIFFWTKSLKDSFVVKSDLIMAITTGFKINNIAIPFRQHDVHIHHIDNAENKENK